ncbi:MAG: flagellar motor switch protein FliG [Myxococcota bacterium]
MSDAMQVEGLTGADKVAVVILAMGPEAARGFLERMSDEEIERVLRAVSRIEEVPPQVRDGVIAEFNATLAEKEGVLTGGRERALALIEGALDAGRARLFREQLGEPDADIASALRGFTPEFIAEGLAPEHPQTIALVLSQIPASRGAAVIAALPEALQADVVLRLADLEAVSPKVIAQLQLGVAETFGRTPGRGARIGGRDVAARLLNRVDKESGAGILEKVDERDAALAQEIRRAMLTFNDLAALDDRGFQQLLREVPTEDLVVALKTASEEMREKVFRNVSGRAAAQIREDSDLLGPMKLSEVEAVQDRVVEAARGLEQQGTISLDLGESDDVLV